MPSALITATVQSHIAQFHKPAIRLLKGAGFDVHVAARNDLPSPDELKLAGVDQVFDVPFERSPIHPRNLAATRSLNGVLRSNKYDIIHCNTPVAGILTRLLGQKARRSGATMIYTAHGFHFFQGAPLWNWLTYYPLERLFARGTDVLVTINDEDYQRAKGFPARRVVYIPGVGVDFEKFGATATDPVVLRQELGIPVDATVALSIGELSFRKNHGTAVCALKQIDEPNVRYLVCGDGTLREELQSMVRELGIATRVILLGYRQDIPALLKVADIYCHPARQEGLPVAVMEAMASGLPIVAARIRGVTDLIEDGVGGILVDRPEDVEGFAAALSTLVLNKARRAAMGNHNLERIMDFSVARVQTYLAEIYGIPLPGSPNS